MNSTPLIPAVTAISRTVDNAEFVTLAGDHHVIVAIITHPAGPAGQPGRDRTGACQRVSLTFLSAESSTHPAHFHPNGMHRDTKRLGNLVLDFRRMLAGAVNHHVAAFLRQRQRSLAFQVEMLLPAELKRAFHDMLGGIYRRRGVAIPPHQRAVLKPAASRERLVHGKKGRQFLIFNSSLPGRAAGGMMTLSRNKKHRLSDIVDLVGREQRLVMRRWRDIVGEWQVTSGQDRDHTRRRANLFEIKRPDPSAGGSTQSEGKRQCIGRHRNVIDVAGRTSDMQTRGVVWQGAGDAHAVTSRTRVTTPLDSRK